MKSVHTLVIVMNGNPAQQLVATSKEELKNLVINKKIENELDDVFYYGGGKLFDKGIRYDMLYCSWNVGE